MAQAQTGVAVPELAGLDQTMNAFLARTGVPGGSLAVVKDNRLVYARGFGWADRETRTPMAPDTLMRVGSISKPLTAIAVLKLVEQGRLSLDAALVPLLGNRVGRLADARWNRITVRHLLNHSGGWDAEQTFDPVLPPPEVIAGFGLTLPLRQSFTIDDLIRAMSALPLQFEPGSRYVYSNFGFAILSRIVELAAGMPYEDFVRREVLLPAGIQRARLSSGKRSGRLLGEASYYDSPGAELLPAVYPDTPDPVAAPDGGFYFEIIQGSGAWAASTVDLVRLATAVDGGLLRADLRASWTAAPSFASGQSEYYGLGVSVERDAGGLRWSHDGAINGTYAFLMGDAGNGVRFAVSVNGWPDLAMIDQAIQGLMTGIGGTLARTSRWPSHDLFGSFYSADAPLLASNGVAVSASAIPGVAVAGTYATLFGSNLAGASVMFDGLPASVIFSDRNQLNVLVPEALAGRARVRAEVRRVGQAASTLEVVLASLAPAVFTLSGNGQGPAVAVEDGRRVTVFAAGLGAMRPRVLVEGVEAEVVDARTAQGISAVTFVVPPTVPAGLRTLRLANGDEASRSTVYLWVK